MKKIIYCFLFCFTGLAIKAQNTLIKTPHSSYKNIYKIPADSAYKYIQQDSITIASVINQLPTYQFLYNTPINADSLPTGYYVCVKVKNYKVEASLIFSSNIIVSAMNTHEKTYFTITNKNDDALFNPKVWSNNVELKYDNDTKAFFDKIDRKTKKYLLKIYTATDTLIASFNVQNYGYSKKNNWLRLKYNVGKPFRWIKSTTVKLFTSKPFVMQGYTIFSQPKYKKTDTLKLKTYITYNNKKLYNKPVELYLQYQAQFKNYEQHLGVLYPVTQGSYVFQTPLHDSLVNGINYTLCFKSINKNKQLFNSSFKIEDYVPDEISTYTLTNSKENYYVTDDSIKLFASAKDANGLSLLDAKLKLVLLQKDITALVKDTVYTADTLYTITKPLDATVEQTALTIPTKLLPQASQNLQAVVQFINSNNEIQEKQVSFSYDFSKEDIEVVTTNDSIFAKYIINGTSVEKTGYVEKLTTYSNSNKENISFPFKQKLINIYSEYNFYAVNSSGTVITQQQQIDEGYNKAVIQPITNNDTLGFIINNYLSVPVSYFVQNNSGEIIAASTNNHKNIVWKRKMTNVKQTFLVKIQYIYNGRLKEQFKTIGLFYNNLNINIDAASTVFPGKTDSIKITVTDIKQQPVSHVNLTAVSYNSQLSKDFNIPYFPNLAKYKKRKTHPWLKVQSSPNFISTLTAEPAIKYNNIDSVFNLDSQLYYQLLCTKQAVKTVVVNKKENNFPELSVFAIANNKPEPIQILYVNRVPLFYSFTTSVTPYSFKVFKGYNQVGIRLLDKYIEIDSVFITSGCLNKLVVNTDVPTTKMRVYSKEPFLTVDELSTVENSIFNLSHSLKGGYIIGENKVHYFDYDSYNSNLLAGPFIPYEKLEFYKPKDFDISFKFEPGYQYRPSKQIVRLEKMRALTPSWVFYKKKYQQLYNFPAVNNFDWSNVEDKIQKKPVFNYLENPFFYIEPNNNKANTAIKDYSKQSGTIKFLKHSIDYSFPYIVLHDTAQNRLIVSSYSNELSNLYASKYIAYLINNKFEIAEFVVDVSAAKKLYVNTQNLKFIYNKQLIDSLNELSKKHNLIYNAKYAAQKANEIIKLANQLDKVYVQLGSASCYVKVKDETDAPVAGALVKMGDNIIIATDKLGVVHIKNVKAGKYMLKIFAVGYNQALEFVILEENKTKQLSIMLKGNAPTLNETVITSFGQKKSKTLLLSSVEPIRADDLRLPIKDLSSSISGKLAGVIRKKENNNNPNDDNEFFIRGISTYADNQKPLLVVDGVVFDGDLSQIKSENIVAFNILKSAEATALYGTKAANGVILISTKNASPSLRTKFQDYAIWQPNLITDKQGKASFLVNYPHNITSWQTYVLGINKKMQNGIATVITKAFKPVAAQLFLPSFLIENDTVCVPTKVLNYTSEAMPFNYTFKIKNASMPWGNSIKLQDNKWYKAVEGEATVNANTAYQQKFCIWPTPNADSLQATYSINMYTGFNDGEQRATPVLPKGMHTTVGNFWLLNNDTTVYYNSVYNKPTQLYVAANGLDVLLNEIDEVYKYPYYCMEQTASKLKALVQLKIIQQHLGKPFKYEKDIEFLTNKLLKAQHFDGGWSWWENGYSNLHITCYVLDVLTSLHSTNVLLPLSINNALMFIKNNKHYATNSTQLSTLLALAKNNQTEDYNKILSNINFDSLTVHQQWQYVQIKQLINKDYIPQLNYLLEHANKKVLGAISWGTANYNWYNNSAATNIIAYQVLSNTPNYKYLTQNIWQHFLSQRKNGRWNNTAESSSIVATVLGDMLQQNNKATQKPLLQINGDTSFAITQFPFEAKLSSNIKNISVNNKGGSILYATTYQQYFEPNPTVRNDDYVLQTQIFQNNEPVKVVQAGTKAELTVTVTAKAAAEYVMLEVPLPAGCLLAKNNYPLYHTVYDKDKVIFFIENLLAGKHEFKINLEPRFTGTFTINPAKISLMYFPTFYGNNEGCKVEIK